jgi:hypothetical protein
LIASATRDAVYVRHARNCRQAFGVNLGHALASLTFLSPNAGVTAFRTVLVGPLFLANAGTVDLAKWATACAIVTVSTGRASITAPGTIFICAKRRALAAAFFLRPRAPAFIVDTHLAVGTNPARIFVAVVPGVRSRIGRNDVTGPLVTGYHDVGGNIWLVNGIRHDRIAIFARVS